MRAKFRERSGRSDARATRPRYRCTPGSRQACHRATPRDRTARVPGARLLVELDLATWAQRAPPDAGHGGDHAEGGGRLGDLAGTVGHGADVTRAATGTGVAADGRAHDRVLMFFFRSSSPSPTPCLGSPYGGPAPWETCQGAPSAPVAPSACAVTPTALSSPRSRGPEDAPAPRPVRPDPRTLRRGLHTGRLPGRRPGCRRPSFRAGAVTVAQHVEGQHLTRQRPDGVRRFGPDRPPGSGPRPDRRVPRGARRRRRHRPGRRDPPEPLTRPCTRSTRTVRCPRSRT